MWSVQKYIRGYASKIISSFGIGQGFLLGIVYFAQSVLYQELPNLDDHTDIALHNGHIFQNKVIG